MKKAEVKVSNPEEEFVTKREGKPTITKGRFSEYENGVRVFEPYNETGEAARKMKRKVNDSTRYETAHKECVAIQVPKDSADPYSQMVDEFESLTKDLRKKESPKITVPERCLEKQEGLQIWIEQANGELVIIQRLKCQPTYMKDCIEKERRTYQVLERDREVIMKAGKQYEAEQIVERV